MSIINAKCPNCGRILLVDGNREAGVCEYCSLPFITEKAIYLYNRGNGGTSYLNNQKLYAEEYFQKGVSYLRIEKDKEAAACFVESRRMEPNNQKYYFYCFLAEDILYNDFQWNLPYLKELNNEEKVFLFRRFFLKKRYESVDIYSKRARFLNMFPKLEPWEKEWIRQNINRYGDMYFGIFLQSMIVIMGVLLGISRGIGSGASMFANLVTDRIIV